MTLTKAELQRLAELCDAATPGPWSVVDEGYGHYGVTHPRFPTISSVVYAHSGIDGYGNGSSEANAAYIVAACNDVPALLAELGRKDAELEALRAENERLSWENNDLQLKAADWSDRHAEVASYADVVTDKLVNAVALLRECAKDWGNNTGRWQSAVRDLLARIDKEVSDA